MSNNILVSYFQIPGLSSDKATSIAGDRVQNDIGDSISRFFGRLEYLVMPTIQSFPSGPIFVRSLVCGQRWYISIVNLPVLKMLTFSAGLFLQLLKKNPDHIFVWNSYLFQNIAIWTYKTIARKKPKVIIFIQDIQQPKNIKEIQFFLDLLSIRLVNIFCDLCAPVSEDIVHDFDIKIKSIRVIGGLSESDLDRKDSYEYSNDTYDANYYVMGGAIEPHNGVVRLAKHWPSCGSAGFIHIYGDGSDSNNLIKISNTNRYVRYLGKVSRSEYLNAADRSLGVIVLRYSDGLDSKYFFPSKFLEACALRKNVYCNKFTNFPEELSGYVDFIESNMSDVKNIMSLEYNNKKTREEISQRIIFIRQHYTWNGAMNKIHEALNQ